MKHIERGYSFHYCIKTTIRFIIFATIISNPSFHIEEEQTNE